MKGPHVHVLVLDEKRKFCPCEGIVQKKSDRNLLEIVHCLIKWKHLPQ